MSRIPADTGGDVKADATEPRLRQIEATGTWLNQTGARLDVEKLWSAAVGCDGSVAVVTVAAERARMVLSAADNATSLWRRGWMVAALATPVAVPHHQLR
jgi:hypothetical protein